MANIGDYFVPKEENKKSKKETIFKGKNYRITILSERLVRLEYSKSGYFNDNLTNLVQNRNFEVPHFKIEEDEKYLVITTKYFFLQYVKEAQFKGPVFSPDVNLKIKLNGTDKYWYYNHPEARNFKTCAFSLDEYPKIKFEKGLFSSDGFALIDDSNALIIDDKGLLKKENNDNIDIYLFMYKRDFGLCLKDYYNLTGYPYLPPRYALGIWWSRDRIYNDENLISLKNIFDKNEIPLSVILLNEFWHEKDVKNLNLNKSGYTFSEKLFPKPEEFLNKMHENNIKIGVNIDPNEGIKKIDKCYDDFVKELDKKMDIIPFNAFDKNFMLVFLDKIINPLLKKGVDFFWLDYKEDKKNLEALNYYVMKNFDQENKRGILLTRNTSVAAHRYPILYSGETTVSWDTLNILPYFNSLSANMGISWWSHDVGGFKDGIEDSELYIRNVQFGTFSPIFRFSAKRGAYYKREPWLWDINTFTIVKYYAKLRQKLIPYIYSEGYNYSKNGEALIEPLYYEYPEIYDEPDYKNEYYFGRNLLVCPITKPRDTVMNRSIHKIFLPEGIWYDLKTGKKFNGKKRYITFYKEEDYPVFVKSGTIIPYSLDNTYHNPVNFKIDVFPGKSNTYDLFEDDEISNNYKMGYFSKTTFDYNYLKNNYTLIIRQSEGKNGIIPKKRNYQINFRNTKKADNIEIRINDEILTNYISFSDDTDFIIKIDNVDTSKQLTINCKGNDIEIDAIRIINEDINSIISDLKIKTSLKEKIASIMFSDKDITKKRILIRKLSSSGLDKKFIKMFLKLLEYTSNI